jgi:ferredoxin
MKIVVDLARCCGHARCNAVAPELFEIDEMGYAAVDGFEVPEGSEAAARKGAAACPERAITVV